MLTCGCGMAAVVDEEAEDGDWACISLADLEADLVEGEMAVEAVEAKSGTGATYEQELLKAAGTSSSLDAEVFFAAPRALYAIASDLHEVLAQAESLQFDAARLVSEIAHGPLQPPSCEGSDSRTGDDWVDLQAVEAFGPDTAPEAPPPQPLELGHPAEAATLADYQRRLSAMPPALFVGRELRLCLAEVDRRQDKKDIGRDELIVDGWPISGARDGYEAAVATVSRALQAGEPGAWEPDAAESAAQLFLGAMNRTTSGFAAFEEVLRLLHCDDVAIVSPDSANARPLEAALLGGVALGRCHTRYLVHRADMAGTSTGDSQLAAVDAFFTFRVATARLRELVGASPPAPEIPAAVLVCRG